MGCSGSREAKSIYEAKKRSIPLPAENVMSPCDVARAGKQCGKSAKRAGAVGATLLTTGGRKAYGIPHHSVPENTL